MSTTTSRLALIKPDLIDSMKNWDDQVGSAYEAVDLNFGARALAALPGSSFVGDMIKLTTDGDYYRWDGVLWRHIGGPSFYQDSFESWNMSETRFDFTGTNEGSILFASLFTFVQNRRYLIRWNTTPEWNTSTAGYIRMKLRMQLGGSLVGTGSSQLKEWRFRVDSTGAKTGPAEAFYDYWHTSATATGSVGLFGAAETAVDWHVDATPGTGGTNRCQSHMTIVDAGG